MGKKKGKKEKGKGAEKAAAKLAKKAQKEESMDELEAMIAQFRDLDKSKTEVNIKESKHPSPRINLSMVLHPEKDELILFGGEYYNGKKTSVYNEMFVYNTKKNEWGEWFVPNPPPPRCAHQCVVVPKDGGQMWIFGGEFASPNHAKFYHYNDMWVLHLKEKKWEQIITNSGPSARSGHRMILYKKQIILFGGFHESSRDFIYFNDVYSFNLIDYKWSKIIPTGHGPTARSSCQLALSPNGVIIMGGYSKSKIKKDIDKGNIHTDIFLLSPESQATDKQVVAKWKWERLKDSGSKPSPRSGFVTTAIGGTRLALFGGVFDEDEEEDIDSLFFNTMFCFDVVSYRWFPMELRKAKQPRKKKEAETSVTPDVEESEEPLEDNKETKEEEVWIPCPRMNSLMAMKHNTLYLYGGVYEEGEKQITLNDFWSIDLKKMITWRQIVEADDDSGDWSEEESSGADTESCDEDDNEEASTSKVEDE